MLQRERLAPAHPEGVAMSATTKTAEELFGAALQLPAEQRDAFLSQACAGDSELRQRVQTLLDQVVNPGTGEAEATGDLPPGKWVGKDALDSAPPKTIGTRLGPYKLLQQIGEGGMGDVFLAEQEQPVRRRVALKIIKAGMDSAHVLARFEAERQALALMDHPNIAKVLDAGTTETGRPYFVMELVKGVPLTKYCDTAHLSVRERLELFVPVCQAVQHAHQKGIIHRDLKPSNVLIGLYDGKPIPKVIDFGVAKATSQKLTERTMFTEVGQIVGTLEYVAPEQAELNNLDIDTRADIYSLGAMLYELLTGAPPFTTRQLRTAGFTDMLHLICEVEPARPSTKLASSLDLPALAVNRKLEPAKLTKLIKGDLDWIVMKCLEKDRTRRYETANGLARDLQRYLADEAVEACPPSAGYRLRKYLRRHKTPMLAAVLVMLALVGGTVGAMIGLVQARRAEAAANRERDHVTEAERVARQEADKAKAFSKFLTEDLLLQAQPDKNAPSNRITLLEVVNQAAAKVEERFADQPLLEAEMRKTLGDVYAGLGKFEEAENHLNKAVTIYRRWLGDEAIETYRTLDALGYVYVLKPNLPKSVEILKTSVAGLSAALPADDPDVLAAKTHLLCAYYSQNKLGEFVPLCEETLRLARAKLGEGHLHTWYSLMHVGKAYRDTGRAAEGVALNEEAVGCLRPS
jgi:serine/threonine protein kinase